MSKLKTIGRNESRVAMYTWDILLGLEFLHYNGVVHGNLTTENVLVSANGTCRLTNFGRVERIYSMAHAQFFVFRDFYLH